LENIFPIWAPKKVQTPPTNPKLDTIFFSFGNPNKYEKVLMGYEKKKQNNNKDLISS
jgi:hypothetical protein